MKLDWQNLRSGPSTKNKFLHELKEDRYTMITEISSNVHCDSTFCSNIN
jgi:hypothetical protein